MIRNSTAMVVIMPMDCAGEWRAMGGNDLV